MTAETKTEYQPKTGEPCTCRRGIERDNCPACEGTGERIDFAAIRARATCLRFILGQTVATPAALASAGLHEIARAIGRHVLGDWGEVDAEDARTNDAALRVGGRLLSSYRLPDGVVLWIITEADRSVTTALLPEDY